MGFIAYQLLEESSVRIFMECEDEGEPVSYTHSVDIRFTGDDHACGLSGIDSVLALKKFYKLVFSLEERARERGGDWRAVFDSRERLLEHLEYTRNVRRLSSGAILRVRKGPPPQLENNQQPVSSQ